MSRGYLTIVVKHVRKPLRNLTILVNFNEHSMFLR